MTTRSNKLLRVARVLLGVLFTFSGLNHVLGLVPMPAMAGDTALFWNGLEQTKYFFPLLGAVEAAAGLLLVTGRLVPLALILVAPVALNVAAFHAALAPQDSASPPSWSPCSAPSASRSGPRSRASSFRGP